MRKFFTIIAASVFFVFFAVGALVLSYIYLPFIKKYKKRKYQQYSNTDEKNDAQYAIHSLFRLIIFSISLLRIVDFKFEGFEKLEDDKGCIIIANHPTLIDYVAIISKLPKCENIVKEALWRNIFVKKIITKAGYIANQQSAETFNKIKDSLEQGNNILMFPEGTRTVPNQEISLKRGAAQLAVRTNAQIRMIYISCKPTFLTKQEKWYQLPALIPKFTLVVGDKINPQDFLENTNYPSVAARALTKYLENDLIYNVNSIA